MSAKPASAPVIRALERFESGNACAILKRANGTPSAPGPRVENPEPVPPARSMWSAAAAAAEKRPEAEPAWTGDAAGASGLHGVGAPTPSARLEPPKQRARAVVLALEERGSACAPVRPRAVNGARGATGVRAVQPPSAPPERPRRDRSPAAPVAAAHEPSPGCARPTAAAGASGKRPLAVQPPTPARRARSTWRPRIVLVWGNRADENAPARRPAPGAIGRRGMAPAPPPSARQATCERRAATDVQSPGAPTPAPGPSALCGPARRANTAAEPTGAAAARANGSSACRTPASGPLNARPAALASPVRTGRPESRERPARSRDQRSAL